MHDDTKRNPRRRRDKSEGERVAGWLFWLVLEIRDEDRPIVRDGWMIACATVCPLREQVHRCSTAGKETWLFGLV